MEKNERNDIQGAQRRNTSCDNTQDIRRDQQSQQTKAMTENMTNVDHLSLSSQF